MSKENAKVQENQQQENKPLDQQPEDKALQPEEKPEVKPKATEKPKWDWKQVLTKVGKVAGKVTAGAFCGYGVLSFVKAIFGGGPSSTMPSDPGTDATDE